jgi:hypothetical protein
MHHNAPHILGFWWAIDPHRCQPQITAALRLCDDSTATTHLISLIPIHGSEGHVWPLIVDACPPWRVHTAAVATAMWFDS